MSYQLVQSLHKKAFAVCRVCQVLGVSRSGYYSARHRRVRQAIPHREAVHLKAAFADSGRSYGSRRLHAVLKVKGFTAGRTRVRRWMRELGLRPVWKRKFVATTHSRHHLPVFENILNRQFAPTGPNSAWVADITYIRTRAGWLYLAAVLDLYSRKVVGWAMAPHMPSELVCTALQMAITQRQPPVGLVVHSDRGSQYASADHQALLARYGLVGSMSRQGNCWDNAVMERFFLSLKMERVWLRDYANHSEAMRDVTEYLVGFYNNQRLHSTLGYQTPTAYERAETPKQPIRVSENC